METNSALVVGADGVIGRALTNELVADEWKVYRTSRRTNLPKGWLYFDLKDGVDSLPQAALQDTQVVFICGAVTGFTPCANDPEGSRQINVTRTAELGLRFMQMGARVIYLSSNAVFDGTQYGLDERARTSPVTEYGKQKADCEMALLSASAVLPGSCAVVRLTKVVSSMQPLYSGWILNFKSQTSPTAAADLVLCPITTAYVAKALRCIGAAGHGGIYHLTGERDISYHELATKLASLLAPRLNVEKIWVGKSLGAVPAPHHSALTMPHTTGTFGLKPQLLAEVIRELLGQEDAHKVMG